MSDWLIGHLRYPPHRFGRPPATVDDPLTGEDIPLALYVAYELHYRGFHGVDDGWEWQSSLLQARAGIEADFLDAVVREVGPPQDCPNVETALIATVNSGTGPSLSAYMAESGTIEQFREFAIHRSAYQLKEADPHTWALPRLTGVAKVAMAEIQYDEYGAGVSSAAHAEVFQRSMTALGLDHEYGRYLDQIPGITLTTVNLMSYFGLHRRWRGALVGHLAIFEMASVGPNSRYSRAVTRFGLGREAADFYDVHVRADELHQDIALRRLAAGFAVAEPALAGDVIFGARAIMAVEERFTRHLIGCWERGTTSLLQ